MNATEAAVDEQRLKPWPGVASVLVVEDEALATEALTGVEVLKIVKQSPSLQIAK